MAAFNLKKTLKQIDPDLRQALFLRYSELASLDWLQLKKKRQVDLLFNALLELPNDQKRDIQLLLRTFLSLKEDCHLKVLLEELRDHNPELVHEWAKVKTKLDKVIWTYLNARAAFQEAVIFVRADDLAKSMYWRKWQGVSCGQFSAGDDRIDALKHSLIDHHSGEFRGDACEIHHYTRKNGAEYLFAYLPNWPENFMVFNREGELESLDLPTAFSILYVLTPSTGSLEIIASGGQSAQLELRRRFYQAMTQTEVEDLDPERPTYSLDHLLEEGFDFTGQDSAKVERVEVSRLLVYPRVEGFNIEGLQLRIRKGTTWDKIIEKLDHMITAIDLSRAQLTVEEIWIRIQCSRNGEKRPRMINLKVTPRACNLKSIDDDDLQEIGLNCLEAWKISHD